MSNTLVMESPVGRLRLRTDGESLTEVHFIEDGEGDVTPDEASAEPVLVEARRQLQAYFAGELDEFDLPLAAAGTDFQKRVWARLAEIPFGGTASYGEIAAQLEMPPGGSRAVGLANGANPIAIVVPCHRVIGANGTLTGYAGGLARKKYLLDLESRRAAQGSLFR
jgi:methylated-DNA-[protein]-cysteine S-methyltransferase